MNCYVHSQPFKWPADQFIIDSYEFDKYIFFVDYCDLETIGSWNIEGKQVDIIIRKCIDVAAAPR